MTKSNSVTSRLSAKLGATETPETQPARTDALGRVLITVYLILALAATLRGLYQIIAKYDEAPVAYTLSLISGLVYIVATIALMRRTRVWTMVAWVAIMFELVGVLVIGTLSIVMPEWFAHDSVWSWYGMNYFWIPLVLPILGMIWLRRDAKRDPHAPGTDQMTESVY